MQGSIQKDILELPGIKAYSLPSDLKNMSLQIIPFKSGINTCYILKDKGAVLIDGAWPGAGASFSRTLSSNGINPEEIQLIVLTHGDFDHVGGTKELKE